MLGTTWPIGSELLVRINDVSTEWWQADLEAFATATNGLPHGFMVPKVRSVADLELISSHLDKLEPAGTKRWLLPIATEVPDAVFELRSIAKGPRVHGITWGCEDLSTEIGARSTHRPDGGREKYLRVFELVRCTLLLAAKAAGVIATPLEISLLFCLLHM